MQRGFIAVIQAGLLMMIGLILGLDISYGAPVWVLAFVATGMFIVALSLVAILVRG